MRLKKVRIYADLKQREVAEILGVSRNSYNTWERENDLIPLRQLDHFCEIFQVSLDYVLGLGEIWEYPGSKVIDPKLLAKRIKRIRRENDVTRELDEKMILLKMNLLIFLILLVLLLVNMKMELILLLQVILLVFANIFMLVLILLQEKLMKKLN